MLEPSVDRFGGAVAGAGSHVVLRVRRVLVRETGEWRPVSDIYCNLNEDLRWVQQAVKNQVSKIRQTDYADAVFSLVKTLAEYSRGCAQIFRQQRYGIESGSSRTRV